MNNISKKEKGKYAVVLVAVLVMVVSIARYTYSFFQADVTENNKTESKIKTNTLGLIYTGEEEISTGRMIPGDSFEKTFSVENTSSVPVIYNIYMENVTNGFNEDLVYTLKEGNTPLIEETPLPVTKEGKTYIKLNIEIGAKPTKHNYTLKIEYKYLPTPQNDYQGAEFHAYLGIDATQLEPMTPATPVTPTYTAWEPTYFAYGNTITTDITDYTTLAYSHEVGEEEVVAKVFIGMDAENNKGVCTLKSGTLNCFQAGLANYETNKTHVKAIFTEVNSCSGETDVTCTTSDYSCEIAANGDVTCSDINAGYSCNVDTTGNVSCSEIN